MTWSRPVAALILLVASPASAAPSATHWTTYEKSTGPDGAPARCLEHRRGVQQAAAARWYVFQIYNDCGRSVRAACAIAYTPDCDYGRDVTAAARFDALVAPFAESAVFGRFVPAATGAVPGCFFVRCTEAEPSDADGRAAQVRTVPARESPSGLTGR
jgi:hypothetical protein